jgi:hypothetical protein
MSKASAALNNLRACIIVLVLAFHSFIAYLQTQPPSPLPFGRPPYGWTVNPIIDGDRWLGFDIFCAFQFLSLMQMMFFLSGLFVWPSLQRKGWKTFLYDRLLRLGVPFVLGASLLMPVAYYPVYRVTALDPSWSAYWAQWMALPFWPLGPMWFLSFLLVLNAAAAGLYLIAPNAVSALARLSAKAGVEPRRYFIALVVVCALTYLPLAAVFSPWQWVQYGPFGFQPAFAPQYVIFFLAGLAVGAHGLERGLLNPDGVLASRWTIWFGGALAAFSLWIATTALIVKGQGGNLPGVKLAADFAVVLFAAAACFAFVAVFLRFAGARRPITNSIAEHAYGIYFVHYAFVIWLQYGLLGVALPAVAKGAIVLAATLVLSWAVAAAVCRIPVGARLILGNRRILARAALPGSRRYSEADASE